MDRSGRAAVDAAVDPGFQIHLKLAFAPTARCAGQAERQRHPHHCLVAIEFGAQGVRVLSYFNS
jgi:hypothetical protein